MLNRIADDTHRLLIDGHRVAAASGRSFETLNPATGEVLAKVAEAGAEDVDAAVRSSRAAFEGAWSHMKASERGALLLKLADLIRRDEDELVQLESLDSGKPVSAIRRQDLPAVLDTLTYYAGMADKINGQVIPARPDALTYTVREPLGVVGAIIPWNFPLMIGMWKIAPALACGCTVVLKPAEVTPLTALKIGELALEAGLPAGVLNVVPGFGEDAGRALGLHPDVDALVFTGSTKVGKLFMTYAGTSNMKQVWLETGGKSPNLVFADADLDRAAEMAAFGILFNSGEVCSANSRLLVHRSVQEEFTQKLIAATAAWPLGDPLDLATRMGPLVEKSHADRVASYIDIGRREARLAHGGARETRDGSDCYIQPTIFNEVAPDARIAREEIFGPVLAVTPFDSDEEALRIANDSEYGLAASVWTKDLSRALSVSDRLNAGTVSVNTVDALSAMTPFGGVKQSGFGRDLSIHSFDKYCALKTVWVKY